MPDVIGLVNNAAFIIQKLEKLKKNWRCQWIRDHDKYITTDDFHKFSGTIFDERF